MAQRQFRSDDTSTWQEKYGNGSDGALTISSNTTETPIDASCSGTSGTTSLSATNASFTANQLILIHQTRGTGAGNWELNKIASYTAGTITTAYPLINTYTDSGASQAQVRVLPQYSSVTINNGVTYTAKAWNGDVGGILAFVCNGTVTVSGIILATGRGFRGGAGAVNSTAQQGESENGTGSASRSANGAGGGGGQGGQGGGFGGTGYQTIANLTSRFVFGGGGGGANSNSGTGATGANSGGLILIIAKTITVTGNIGANGNNGSVGSDGRGGSGGGGGGAILLKGQNITLGSNLVTAIGGNGGAPANGGDGGGGGGGQSNGGNASSVGGTGSSGRIHVDYSDSLSGTTNPTLDATQNPILADTSGSAFLLHFI